MRAAKTTSEQTSTRRVRRLTGFGVQHAVGPCLTFFLHLSGAIEWSPISVAFFTILLLWSQASGVWLLGGRLVSIHLLGGRGVWIKWCHPSEVEEVVQMLPRRPFYFLWMRDGLLALRLSSGRVIPIPQADIRWRQWWYGPDWGLIELVGHRGTQAGDHDE